jgi:hypothetical protein
VQLAAKLELPLPHGILHHPELQVSGGRSAHSSSARTCAWTMALAVQAAWSIQWCVSTLLPLLLLLVLP